MLDIIISWYVRCFHVFVSSVHIFENDNILLIHGEARGGLMVSAFDSRASDPGLSPGQEHCVLFLGKTLYSHNASLHPGV